MVTWAQLELHHKPCGLLNCFGFFDGLLGFIDHQVQQGFLIPANRALLLEATTPEDLLTLILDRLEPDVR
jgi:predicted Rossmann-fold nucleotide-binding protein